MLVLFLVNIPVLNSVLNFLTLNQTVNGFYILLMYFLSSLVIASS